jgi:membrane-bound hydrogenase subunit alpha
MSGLDHLVPDDFRIPIGPQHPALKEPVSFSVALKGEKIQGVDIRLGYNHRGIEKAAEERTYIQDVYLLERICGICSHSHSTAFVTAVEEIAQLQVPKRGLYVRTIIGELERIHSHLLWLGVAGHEIGFDTLLMYSWRDREIVMDLLSEITGNRVNYGMNTIGGVRRDISSDQAKHLVEAMKTLKDRTQYYVEVCTQEQTVVGRLSGVGIISYDDCVKFGVVGPTARASGVDRDCRRDDPSGAYPEIKFNVITDKHADVFGRAVVRLMELMESYSMITQLASNLPEGPISVRSPRRIPAGEAICRYEAPRGEDMHYVKSNGSDHPERVKVRAPTLANMMGVKKMLENRELADLPIVVAAIDPCMSCTDRSIMVDDGISRDPKEMEWEQIRQLGIDWYKKNRGIDMSVANIRLAGMRAK